MHFFHPVRVQHKRSKMTGKITITVTPLQAQRILQRAQGSGQVQMNFKESGKQSGGFLPMLAALPALGSMAMPLLSGAASALGGLATSQIMKKLTGSGVCVTCTKAQMDKLKQSGCGITVNFKISKSKKNPQAMMGAGITDQLPEMLLQPLKQMAQVAASKVAQKAGEVMASKAVQKLFGHTDEAQKKVKKVKKKRRVALASVSPARVCSWLVEGVGVVSTWQDAASVNMALALWTTSRMWRAPLKKSSKPLQTTPVDLWYGK